MELFPKSMKTVLLLIIFIVLPQPSSTQENKVCEIATRQTVSWSELIFKGTRFLTSITVKIQLGSGDNFSGDLSPKIEKDIGDCSETVNDGTLLTVQSSSTGLGFSKGQYEEKIWFKERAVRPYKRIRSSKGNAPWVKSYCWEDKGVRRQKNQPANSRENKIPPAKWTKRTVSFYEYPDEVAGCDTISDPSLIFYILSTHETGRQQKPFEICIFGKKQLHRLSIRQEDSSPLQVSYKTRSLSQEATVKDQITPFVFSITPDTLAPDNREPEIFSFLGLHKDIRIYMDPEKRLPVRISGTNNSIGDLVLDLRAYSR